jgi:hypothetical protein
MSTFTAHHFERRAARETSKRERHSRAQQAALLLERFDRKRRRLPTFRRRQHCVARLQLGSVAAVYVNIVQSLFQFS